MATWLAASVDELTALALEKPPRSARLAGRIYEFASQLNEERARSLPKVGRGNPDIRWWEIGHVITCFRVDVAPPIVLLIGPAKTPYEREQSIEQAVARCRGT